MTNTTKRKQKRPITIKNIREFSQVKRLDNGEIKRQGRKLMLIRRISAYPTKLFLLLGLSANFVSFLGIILYLSGILSLFILPAYPLLAVLLMFLGFLMDFCDGEIARFTNTLTHIGIFFEGFSKHLVCGLTGAFLGIYAYIFISQNPLFLLLGFTISISRMFILLYTLVSYICFPRASKLDEPEKLTTKKTVVNELIRYYNSIFLTFMALHTLALAFIFNHLDYYLIFYGATLPIIVFLRILTTLRMFLLLDKKKEKIES